MAENLVGIRDRIAAVAKAAGRDPATIQLLAVSKKHSADAIREALDLNQTRFGENTVQEAVEKIAVVSSGPAEWHFIGQIQSNKTSLIAESFDWVQSIDREKIAIRLNTSRPSLLPALNVCIQLNLENEAGKGGVTSAQAMQKLAEKVTAMKNLQLRGVMSIPPVSHDVQQQREQFKAVNEHYCQLKAKYSQIDTLSMGMTADFESAIQEGSTMIRLGTAIFGARS